MSSSSISISGDEDLHDDNHKNNDTRRNSGNSMTTSRYEVGGKNFTMSAPQQQHDSTVADSASAPANEAWRLRMEHKWTSLQMRLGMFPDEARRIDLTTKRSLLHEVVCAAAMEASGETAAGSTSTRQQKANEVDDVDDIDALTRRRDYFINEFATGFGAGRLSSENKMNDENRQRQHEDRGQIICTDIVTPLMLRSVYFSCPQAMLLVDSIKGYTPLHCALVTMKETSKTAGTAPKATKKEVGDGFTLQQQRSAGTKSTSSSSSSSFDLVRSLLDLSLGRCVVDNDDDDDYDEDDYDSLLFEDDEEEKKDEDDHYDDDKDEDDQIDNEEAVLLMRDSLMDTPLHTACRHGCSKSVLLALMEACPSALFHYNIAKMSPLRLLWHNLEERVCSKKRSSDNSINRSFAATSIDNNESLSPQNDQRVTTELEDILINKINCYKDLTNYPSIHETLEKSLLLLHLYRLSLSNSTISAEVNDMDNDADDVSLLGDFKIPQSMTYNQIKDLIYGSKMDILIPPQDAYCDFLKRIPCIFRRDYRICSTTKDRCEDVKQQHQSEQTKSQGTTLFASTGRKRKHFLSFYVKGNNPHHHGDNHSVHNKDNNNNNKQTTEMDFVKGIHPDENGMIPMPSYKSVHDEYVKEQYKSNGTSFQHYEDEPNFFFDLEDD